MQTNCLTALALILSLLSLCPAGAQVEAPFFGRQRLINGYERSLQGETLPYFSVYPNYAKEALLTRCTDGKKVIEWETDAIPADLKGPFAYFTWIAAHSSGTSGGERHFDLFINDRYALTFTTYARQYPPYWTFAGPDSTRLVFEFRTRDGADDSHGMAYLRVPLASYPRGKPLKIRVVGQAQNSNDWYMTFQYAFREKVDITPLPFLLRGGADEQQPVRFTVLHFGAPEELTLVLDGRREEQFPVENGFNVFELAVNAVKEPTPLNVKARIGNLLTVDETVYLKPVMFREIDLVHHSHTDIGYSHIQEEVIKIHVDNISKALDLIDKTRGYPEGSRFVWNIESAWAVEHFLQQAGGEDRRRFFAAVKSGQIVVAATYANVLTGLCTPEELTWLTEYARRLRDEEGIPVNTAMMTDIPGMSWSMVPALAQYGIRYFSNGPNYMPGLPDRGDRIGHTLRAQGDRPFWWKSPSGRDSTLLWTCGRGYSAWHGFAPGAVAERGADKIADYLNDLDSTGYPYSIVQWRYNIVADNGPVDSTISDFVKNWNEKYVSPKLVLANVADLFARFEQQYGRTLPVYSGDFTPYWEDGAYSTAKEEGDARVFSEKLLALEQVARQENISVDADWWYQARKNLLLFQEHTWGAWCSISRPDDPFSIHQWEYKKSYLDSVRYYLGRIEAVIWQDDSNFSQLTVANPSPWPRSGYVELEWPPGFTGDALVDDEGNTIPVQRTAEGRLCFIAADVPANGEKIYRFSKEKNNPPRSFQTPFTFRVDSLTGAVTSLRTPDREWLDPVSNRGLLQAIYVNGLDPANHSLTRVERMEWVEDGPVVQKLRITCGMEGSNDVVYEISRYNGLDYLQLSVSIDKKAVREKEAVHIAFPFALPDPTVRIGVGDRFFTPEDGQIPGANKDFFSVQRWLDVSGGGKGVTLSSPQGALFEIGDMVDEERINNGYKKWKDRQASSSTLFLYALNNYWHTNYKADQEGVIRFDVYLSFHGAFEAGAANRFGYEMAQPLLCSWGELSVRRD